MAFVWTDLLTGKVIKQYSVAYEKACTLFNLVAISSQIAVRLDHTTSDGLKQQCILFQFAAGVCKYIGENFLHAPTIDISRDFIGAFRNLMMVG